MFSCGDYEKVKQDVWEENWKAMQLYSVVALVAFGVITLVSVFSLSIGKFKWVYVVLYVPFFGLFLHFSST